MILELRGGKRLLEADPETGEVRLLFTSPSPNRDLFYGYRDHYMYIADDKLIQLTDLDTGKALNIETVGFQALSLTIAGDRLLALTNQGKLMVYSLEGQLLCQRNLNLQSDDLMNYGVHYWTLPDISWFFPEENTLILQIGGNCSMINCRRWTPIISLKDKYFYDCENDLFVISAHTLLTVQRYRLEELMAHAQAILGDYRLSPRQRSAYGIQETDQNIFVTDPQA